MIEIVIPFALLSVVMFAAGWAWSRSGRVYSTQIVEPASPVAGTQLIDKRQAILKVLAADRTTLSQSRLQVKHAMTPRPAMVSPEMSTKSLAAIMRQREHRHALVCDDDHRLIGVVGDRDIYSRKGRVVRDLMNSDPVTVRPDGLISAAVSLMLSRRISCLPVVDGDGTVRGVVTTSDMLMTFQCMLRLADGGDDTSSGEAPTERSDEGVLAGHSSF